MIEALIVGGIIAACAAVVATEKKVTGIRIKPSSYTAQVTHCAEVCATKLKTGGYTKKSHLRMVLVIPGTHVEKHQWTFWSEHSKQWVCAEYGNRTLRAACDPATGNVADRVFIHEIAHSILNNYEHDTDKQHAIMRSCGVY